MKYTNEDIEIDAEWIAGNSLTVDEARKFLKSVRKRAREE
jgi:hypothetical protein